MHRKPFTTSGADRQDRSRSPFPLRIPAALLALVLLCIVCATAVAGSAIAVPRRHGAYPTAGRINGVPTRLELDPDTRLATVSAVDARRFGVDYRRGVRMRWNGAVGYRVLLRRVEVGDIRVRNVAAVVLESNGPPVPRVGRSFLGRIKTRNTGGTLYLRPAG